MKKNSLLILILCWSLFWLDTREVQAQNGEENQKKAIFFYQEACEHCQKVDRYFQETGIYTKYEIKKIEVTGAYNLDYFNELFAAFKIAPEKRGWPVIFFDKKFLVGDQPIIEKFEKEIAKTAAQDWPTASDIQKYMEEEEANVGEKITYTLPLGFLMGAAATDAVSPCSLAVWIILAGIIIFGRPRNSREVLTFGLSFSLAILLLYGGLGWGMFHLESILKLSRACNLSLGAAALILGGIIIFPIFFKNDANALHRKTIGIFLEPVLKKIWKGVKNFLQKSSLALAAVLIGIFSSIFLLPGLNTKIIFSIPEFFARSEGGAGVADD
jgi:cytochrome c biogenesis protein CcdA/glutaredoxin